MNMAYENVSYLIGHRTIHLSGNSCNKIHQRNINTEISIIGSVAVRQCTPATPRDLSWGILGTDMDRLLISPPDACIRRAARRISQIHAGENDFPPADLPNPIGTGTLKNVR